MRGISENTIKLKPLRGSVEVLVNQFIPLFFFIASLVICFSFSISFLAC